MPQMFPYYLAISQAFVPVVIQIADLTGPLGVTALMVACNGAAARRLARARRAGAPRRRPRPAPIVAALIVADLGYGARAPAPGRRAPRRRAQGADRRRAGQRRHPREVGSARVRAPAGHCTSSESAELARAGAELIVWPESSYPYALRAPARPFAHDFPPTTRAACGAASTRRCCSARSRAAGPPQAAERYPYNTALMMDARRATSPAGTTRCS